jgi:hypothetical protein
MKDTTMATITQETRIELSRRESLMLGNLRGQLVECRRGELWLTVDGEGRDVILGPGQRYAVTSSAPTVVTALRDSAVHLHRPAPRPSRLAALRAALARLHPGLITLHPSIR